jgi:membrane associated rhomboid family serine protease
MDFTSEEERLPAPMTPVVRGLLALNIAVLFLQMTIVGGGDMMRAFAFQYGTAMARPWTAITYMFAHAGFWHLLSNMWLLFVFGPRVERDFGSRRFAFYYLVCGLGGLLAHIALAPRGGYLLGASAAVLGVLLAYAVRWPDDEVQIFPLFFTMKVRWLVVVLAAINVLFGLTSAGVGSGVAYAAHLGGLAAGMVFMYVAAGPGIERVRRHVSAVPDESDEPPRAIPRPPARSRERTSEADEAVARSNAAVAQPPVRSAPLASRVGRRKTEELDSVLDKISRLGLDSLTADERKLLEEMSRQLRDR